MHAVAFADALWRVRIAAVEIQRVELAIRHEVAVRIDENEAGVFVDGEQAVDVPVAAADRVIELAVECIQVQVLVAAAFAGPDEGVALLEEAQVVVEVDPGVAGFGEQRLLRQRRGVGEVQVEPFLVALQELVRECLASGSHSRGPGRCRYSRRDRPSASCRRQADETELDQHIGLAGRRVALLDHFGAVGIDLEAPDRSTPDSS